MAEPILVYASGGESPLSQIDRVRQGLAAQQNVVLTDKIEEADLVYVNNPPYDNVLRAAQLKPSVKKIFNVLDLPLHLLQPNGDYTFEKMAALCEQLKQAEAITVISQYVQGQVQQYLGLASTVIYNPVKDVSPKKRLEEERPYGQFKVLMAGRVNDPNKRQRTIGIPALIMAGFNESEVAIVGGEYPGWGTNLGIVHDDVLSDLYNSVDYVMFPSVNEGLGLPPLEGMICGAIPIVCHDLTVVSELPYPRHWWCYPSPSAVAYHLYIRQQYPQVLEADRQHCLTMSDGLAEDLGKNAVARRIMNVYYKLVGLPQI